MDVFNGTPLNGGDCTLGQSNSSIENDIFDLSSDFEGILGSASLSTTSFNLDLPDVVLKNLDTEQNDSNQGVDIKESLCLTKKKRLIDPNTVNEFALKFGLSQVDTNNLKKINSSEAINIEFFLKLREIFTAVEVKSKLMDLFSIRKSYTGFHDWYDGHRIDLPSVGMDAIASNMGYSLMIVPIKNNDEHKHKKTLNELQGIFLDEITERVSVLVSTTPKKNKTKEPEESEETTALLKFLSGEDDFGITEDNLDPKTFLFDNSNFIEEEGEPLVNNTVILNNDININVNEEMVLKEDANYGANQWGADDFDMVSIDTQEQ